MIISRDIGYFMLVLFYLENLMGDFQYKTWFSIRVRGYPQPSVFSVYLPFSIFSSGVELKLCLLLENVNILLKWWLFVEIEDILCWYYFTQKIWWVIFNIKHDFLSEWGGTPNPQCFLYTFLFQYFFWTWTKIVSSIRKCKNLA